MNHQPIVIVEKKEPHIALLSLNRIEGKNALNIELLASLIEAINRLQQDKDVRVLVFKGEGASFCSGLDIKEASDPVKSPELSRLMEEGFKAVYNCPLLTIAAVHGTVTAGGAALMTACDYSLVSDQANFGYPEVKKGLVGALVMTFLKRRILPKDIRELLLFGDIIDAKRALSIGLVNKIVKEEDLIEEVMATARKGLKGSPNSIKKTKELLKQFTADFDEDLHKMMIESRDIRNTPESKKGMQAYLEGKDPVW